MKLEEIKINDQRTRNNLSSYLNKIESYRSFNLDQPLRLFLTIDNDLIALESEEYNWSFVSFLHKPSEIRSAVLLAGVPYKKFKSWLDQSELPF